MPNVEAMLVTDAPSSYSPTIDAPTWSVIEVLAVPFLPATATTVQNWAIQGRAVTHADV